MLRVTINGVEHNVRPGTCLLDALEQARAAVPHTCHDERLSPAGACRPVRGGNRRAAPAGGRQWPERLASSKPSQLDYRLRELFAYLENDNGSMIAYGKHYRKHKPISTAMAESAVHQVVNTRKCKRQQALDATWRPSACPGAMRGDQ
jgi:hypothetical protein